MERTRELQPKSNRILQVTKETSDRENILLWHCRQGHPSFPYLERLFPHLFKTILVSSLRCKQCIYANKSLVPFVRVFIDVWGPFSTPFALGPKYFVPFTDDCTRVGWVYLLKSKHDILHVIPQFSKMVITQFNV